MRDTRTLHDDWQRLVRFTRFGLLFASRPRVRSISDGITIVDGWAKYVVSLLFFAAGAGLIIWACRSGPQSGYGVWFVTQLVVCSVLAIGAVALGLGLWCWDVRIVWRRGDDAIHVQRRRTIRRDRVNIAAGSLTVELMLFGASDARRFTQTGVRLRLRESDEPPVLLYAGPYAHAHRLFEQLAVIIPEATDRTREPTKNWSGSVVQGVASEITRAPLGRHSYSCLFEQTRAADDSVLVYRPAKKLWLVPPLALLVGGGAFYGSSSMQLTDDGAWYVLVIGVGAVFVVVGLMAAYALAVLRIKIDELRQVIEIRSLVPGRRQRTIAFSDVYALQLCTWVAPGSEDAAGSVMHELNLVLNRPAGGRVGLMNCESLRQLQQQGAELGKVIGKPVLDHSSAGDWIVRRQERRSHVGADRCEDWGVLSDE